MTSPGQPSSVNCAPFVPVSKEDAAKVLRVHPRTIDNYIASGLLPQPRQFGCRAMWHPDVFYGHLAAALSAPAAPDVLVEDAKPAEQPTVATARPRASKPLVAVSKSGGRLEQRLAEMNQRHAA